MKKSFLLPAIVLGASLFVSASSSFATTYVFNGKKSDKPHLYSYTDVRGVKHTGYWGNDGGARTWHSADRCSCSR